MAVNWSASEIKIKLIPVGKTAGRQPTSMSVYRSYGDVKVRAVQAIANRLGSDTVYVEIISPKDDVNPERVTNVIPIAGWRDTSNGTYIGRVINVIMLALSANYGVRCYGLSRERWQLEFSTSNECQDAIDNMSDKGTVGGSSGTAVTVEENGIRTDF